MILNNVPPGVSVDADREQLVRILTNLARNAIQAIESLQAERQDAPDGIIAIEARREGSVAVIEIKDNGPGIPNQIRDRLFQAFQSAARQGGTGLGLAIAAELVRAHGGDIRLQSSTDAGTCFIVTIPDQVAQLRAGLIQPHLPVRLPCYDLALVTCSTLTGFCDEHQLQVYQTSMA